MKKSLASAKAQFLAFIQALLPSNRKEFFSLAALSLLFFIGTEAAAMTIDSMGGQEAGTQLCSFGKSVEKSIFVKGLCVAVSAYGLLKWLPTRKDGTNEMVGGVIGLIIASKFMTIIGWFGAKC